MSDQKKENPYLLKASQVDDLNRVAQESLGAIEKLCGKKVVFKTNIGSYWEGVISGYDMFYIHLVRNNKIEKLLITEIDEVKVLE